VRRDTGKGIGMLARIVLMLLLLLVSSLVQAFSAVSFRGL